MVTRKTVLALLLLASAAVVFATGSQEGDAEGAAEPQKYGDLRLGLVDADGDLVADAPTDSSEWIDPETLVFAYTPVEDPEVYRGVWSEFLDHLSEATGKPVQFFPVQSNAAQLEAMRAGRLHVAGYNTGSNPIAVNCAGFVPFAMMAGADGSFGYEMEIITHVDSDIEEVEDLAGTDARVHLAHVELGLQSAERNSQGRVRSHCRRGLRDDLLRRARRVDPRCLQQGLRGRLHRELGQGAHDRPGRDR